MPEKTTLRKRVQLLRIIILLGLQENSDDTHQQHGRSAERWQQLLLVLPVHSEGILGMVPGGIPNI